MSDLHRLNRGKSDIQEGSDFIEGKQKKDETGPKRESWHHMLAQLTKDQVDLKSMLCFCHQ